MLGQEEGYLWPSARPDLAPGAEATSEIVAAYAHRVDVPRTKWSELLATSRRNVDILGYAFLFFPEQHIDRFDDQMIVTPYLYRAHGFHHPALQVRRLGPYGLFADYLDEFENIWQEARPSIQPAPLAAEAGR